MIRQNVAPPVTSETDEEFAREIGIILPDSEDGKAVEENPKEGGPECGDPWSERHRAAC